MRTKKIGSPVSVSDESESEDDELELEDSLELSFFPATGSFLACASASSSSAAKTFMVRVYLRREFRRRALILFYGCVVCV